VAYDRLAVLPSLRLAAAPRRKNKGAPMRNAAEVLIDKDGIYMAIGIDRSSEELAHFVRLDINGMTLLIGANSAVTLAEKLIGYAEELLGADEADR
jgi:hypothetical protein